MNVILRLSLLLLVAILSAQAPTISGDQFLCINTNGTAIVEGDVQYDSYQWYRMVSYEEDAQYEAIPGATTNQLNYNIEYNEYLIKVVVTKDGETYESNELYLEAPWVTGILMQVSFDDPNEYTDEDGHHICEGYAMRLEILGIWAHNVKWLKDGEIIEGATGPIYYATQTGYYAAFCANEICPEDFSHSLGATVTVHECGDMNVKESEQSQVQLYPNPTTDYINIQGFDLFSVEKAQIYNANGKMVKEFKQFATKSIDVKDLIQGVYFIRLIGNGKSYNFKFIKN